MDQAGNMPRYIRNIKEQFDRVFQGTSAEQPRTAICAVQVNNNMGMVVSKLYIKSYFDEDARKQVLKNYILNFFISHVVNSVVRND
jgi:predicted metalloendopeptidase